MIFAWCIAALAACFSAFLWWLSLGRHGAMDWATFSERITLAPQNPMALFFFALAALGLSAGLQYALRRRSEKARHRLYRLCSVAAFLWMTGAGLFWIRTNPYPPIADQFVVWDAARCLAEGRISSPDFAVYADYLRVYPFQRGLILFCEQLIRLFGPAPTHSFRVLNVLAAAGIVLLLSKITRSLARDSAAGILALLWGCLFLPLLLFTPFVYGTLLSYVCVLAALDAALVLRALLPGRPLRGKAKAKLLYLLPALFLPALACQLYTASWIAVIALVLFLLCSAFGQYRQGLRGSASLSSLAVGILMTALLFQTLSGEFFALRTGLETGPGTPASTYVYMGISSENGAAGPGSHNGSDIGLFSDYALDPAATDAAARALIKETLGEYADGSRSLSFFVEKAAYQWTDPWFSSLVLTIHPQTVPVTESPRFKAIAYGWFFPLWQKVLAALLPLCYLGALGGVVLLCKRKEAHLSSLLLCLYFVGGFVFQFFWEAKARYCLPYFLILLPFAALALSEAGRRFLRAFKL